MNLKQLREKRANLLREAEGLRGRDGSFLTDQARTDFDATMAEIDRLDEQIRAAVAEQDARSRTLVERNPLDPGAPTGRLTLADEREGEPTDADRAITAERERVQGIITACRAARMPQAFADALINDGTSLVESQSRIFTEMEKRGGDRLGPQRSQGASVTMGDDPLVHVRAGIESALLHRVAPQFFKMEDIGRQYRSLSLLDTAKIYLQARGIRVTDLPRMEIAGVALGLRSGPGYHGTSDFPYLLADVANKTLRRAYDEYPVTFGPIVRRTTVPDFKTVNRVQLGDAPALAAVLASGEFTHGSISEGREQFAVSTYGRIFSVNRQTLVNDDTDAFARVPALFGRAFRNLESDLVWAQITNNGLMGDGIILFGSAHANIAAEAGGDGAPDVTTIGAGRAAMRKQTGLDGQKINVVPRYLIVPTSLETVADQLTTSITPALAANVNVFSGKLQVIAEPRLDDNSVAAWYLAASPDQIDIIELAMLEGQDGPMVESRIGFDVDGLEIKARHDVAAKVLDWRGLFKNEGDT